MWRFLTSHTLPPFCNAGLSQSLPETSRINDVGVREETLRHRRNDGWSGTPTIVVPGSGGRDPSPALEDAKSGGVSVFDGLNAVTTTSAGRGSSPAAVGFCRARKYPRTTAPLLLGRPDKVEKLVVGSPATEQRGDAGNHQVEAEEKTRKDGKWSESGHRTATNTNLNINLSESDGGGSNSKPQRGEPVQNDRVDGVYFDQIEPWGCFGLIGATMLIRHTSFYRPGLRDRGLRFRARPERSRRGRSSFGTFPSHQGRLGLWGG